MDFIREIAGRVTIRGRINEEWRKVEETVVAIIRRKLQDDYSRNIEKRRKESTGYEN